MCQKKASYERKAKFSRIVSPSGLPFQTQSKQCANSRDWGSNSCPYRTLTIAPLARSSLGGPLSDLSEPLSPGSDPLDPFFDAVYTAQDIGSYKPDLRNFEYLINHVKADFKVEKHEILHVAQSLGHGQVPSKQIELDSVWIARGKGGVSGMGGDVEELLGKVAFAWKFESLGDFADAVEAELQKYIRLKSLR